MKKIVIASNNKHKIDEIKSILDNQEFLSLDDVGFKDEIEETGNTFLENALIKAKAVSNFLKEKNLDYDVLADDSGLCCLGINLEPGVYSARYAGNHGDGKANRKKLIESLKGKDKKAYFTCTLVYYHPNDTYDFVEGKTYGKIFDKEEGDTSFGYDAIFYSDELHKTFGLATKEEKNKVSHRYIALKKLKRLMNKK